MRTIRSKASGEGKRVGVIGTGASSVQIVPAIQPRVARLTVFQRSPPWILPRGDRPLPPSARKLFRSLPFTRAALRAVQYAVRELNVLAFENPSIAVLAERYARWHLERSVKDPALRAKLTPKYRFGCKRVLVSDDYLPSFTQPNVELVTDAIREIRPHSVLTADGRAHELDVLVLGTGFHVTHPQIARHLFGRSGRSLEETWAGSPKAHLGTTVSGFPNLFLLQGPNTGLGHNSVLVMIESQIELLLSALRFLKDQQARAIEPRPEVQDAFVAGVDARLRESVWNVGGCQSWYLDSTGRNSAIWPGFTFSFRRQLSRLQPSDYVLT
jgi:cation diffusion facilitator CzcD-associated flavoprotein CzcO